MVGQRAAAAGRRGRRRRDGKGGGGREERAVAAGRRVGDDEAESYESMTHGCGRGGEWGVERGVTTTLNAVT